jgi:HNH endonuclease
MNYRKLWIKIKGPIPVDEQGRSFEIHHIDGNRKNNSIENLQCLSAEDHFKLHYDKKEFFAANLIAKRLGRSLENVINWNMSEEGRERLRESKLGDKNPMRNPEIAKKVADALRGRKKSKEAEKKRLETAKKNNTLRRSEETRVKMRKPKAKIECPHCKFVGGVSTTKRWHFDNCKLIKIAKNK